jgi:hypothetical protein
VVLGFGALGEGQGGAFGATRFNEKVLLYGNLAMIKTRMVFLSQLRGFKCGAKGVIKSGAFGANWGQQYTSGMINMR